MTEEKPKKYRWQLMAGTHAEKQPDGTNRTWDASDQKNNIVETDEDLATRFNQPGSVKFQRVQGITIQEAAERGFADGTIPSNTPAPIVSDGLDAMTIEELREWAAGEEIDLGAFKKKSAIIRCIRQQLAISPALV